MQLRVAQEAAKQAQEEAARQGEAAEAAGRARDKLLAEHGSVQKLREELDALHTVYYACCTCYMHCTYYTYYTYYTYCTYYT